MQRCGHLNDVVSNKLTRITQAMKPLIPALFLTFVLSGCADVARFAGETFTATRPAATGAKIVWAGQLQSKNSLGKDYRGDNESTGLRHIKKGKKLTLKQGECVGADIIGYGPEEFLKVLLLPSVTKDKVVVSHESTPYPVSTQQTSSFSVCFQGEPAGKYVVNIKVNDAANTETFDETSIGVTLLK